MEILKGLLIAVELIVSLLLILIILVQPSKSGGGLGGAAFGGGGMGEQLFGARAGNVLTRGTVIFSVIFLVNTLALAVLYTRTAGLRIEAPAPMPVVEQGLPATAAPVAPAELPVDAIQVSELPADMPVVDLPEVVVPELPVPDAPLDVVPEAEVAIPATP